MLKIKVKIWVQPVNSVDDKVRQFGIAYSATGPAHLVELLGLETGPFFKGTREQCEERLTNVAEKLAGELSRIVVSSRSRASLKIVNGGMHA